MTEHNDPLLAILRHHVSGAVERGEAEPIVAIEATPQPRRIKLLMEVECDVLGTWDDATVLDNAVMYLGSMIHDAEERNLDRFPDEQEYRLDDRSVSLFTAEGYLLDIAELAQ